MISTPRLWRAFVLGWLLVLAVVAATLPGIGLSPARLATGFLGVGLLAALYLWLTLREALHTSDLEPEGPDPEHLRRRAVGLATMAALVAALILLLPGAGMWWLVMHVVVAAGLALPARPAAGTMVGLVAAALASAWLLSGRFEIMLLVQVAFGAGAVAIRQLTVAVEQLRAAREELAHAAVDEERLRFARDLHDLLGHSLSMIALKSELAGRLATGAPARAAAEMADVERVAREALRQVRAAVAGYRQPSLRGELAAARELLGAAGIEAAIDHGAGPLPREVDVLLAWAVREGVTNVIRHSRARSCTLRVYRTDQRASVEILDDGRGAEGDRALGTGLVGLAERATLLGGRLRTGVDPAGGFRLTLEAPIEDRNGRERR